MKKALLTLMFLSYLNIVAQNPIHEFNFNGTLNNTSNSCSFLGTPNFVNDRMGASRGAQQLSNKAMEAMIDDLPQENKPRTVSVWISFNDISNTNYIWGYGTAQAKQYFGLLQKGTTSANSDLSLTGWGASNDMIVPIELAKNVWYNYTVTFDGNISKIYRNGKMLKLIEGLTRNTKGNIFKLGGIHTSVGMKAKIDDLKIYNVAMTDEQVLDLYNTTKPPVLVVEKKIIKPNEIAPKTTIPNPNTTTVVKTKTANNNSPKTIEVYSQGQKVLGTTTQHDLGLNDLPEGTYLLKVTNSSKKVTLN